MFGVVARAGPGVRQILVYSEEVDDPGLGQGAAGEWLRSGVTRGSLTVFEEDGLGKVARPGEAGGEIASASAPGGDDVRTLAIRWHNGRRRRPFHEPVDLMEVHDLGTRSLRRSRRFCGICRSSCRQARTPT